MNSVVKFAAQNDIAKRKKNVFLVSPIEFMNQAFKIYWPKITLIISTLLKTNKSSSVKTFKTTTRHLHVQTLMICHVLVIVFFLFSDLSHRKPFSP